MIGNYEKEVKRFIKVADWLTEADSLGILHLRTIAKSLDKQVDEDGCVQSALANTFGVTLRSLEARRPKVEVKDEDEDDLLFS